MKGSLCGVAVLCGLAMMPAMAQDQPPPPANQQTLSPEQLESMVAPIALYPDSLLSQVLVACTYPLEIVEAGQWLQTHGNLTGPKLVDAAKKQDWDPSVQALVAFQDVLKRLNSDIRWTTDLGNAFLAQQADVMSAVQRLRARAKDSGKLTDTPQENVVVNTQDGQQAIEIQPTNPQVVYVPTYDPGYFWGAPPPMYPWPELDYPGIGIGWGWGGGIDLGFYFGGCCGWGGWGWTPGWFGGGIAVNNHFFHRYGYHDFHGSDWHANSPWVHNPMHRGAVPYPGSVASRYGGGGAGFGGGGRAFGGAARPQTGRSFGGFSGAGRPANEAHPNYHSAFGGVNEGGRARIQSDHGFASMGPTRTGPVFRGGGFGGGGMRGGGGFGGGGGGMRGGGGGRGR